jgi:hypothetical protein
MIASSARRCELMTLSDALKQLRGWEFEAHAHPAVVLDRATGPSVRVWGWWTADDPARPCVLWCGPRGWSVAVVEPDVFDSHGYELVLWAHRIKLLDLALANAVGPYRRLAELELHVASEAGFGVGPHASSVREAVLWGILHLRAARARRPDQAVAERRAPEAGSVQGGVVDEELARHALVPSLAKARVRHRKQKDAAVDALVRALANLRLDEHLVLDEQ